MNDIRYGMVMIVVYIKKEQKWHNRKRKVILQNCWRYLIIINLHLLIVALEFEVENFLSENI